MPLSAAEQAAIDRLRSYYEGDNPYNSVTNPGGFRQGGHLYNFVPALKDLAVVIVGAARLATEVAANSVQSPKAVRVDSVQGYTADEQAQGRANLGLATALTAYLAKAGGVMTGDLEIQNTTARVWLHSPGVFRAALQLGTDAILRWRSQDGTDVFTVGSGGDVWNRQLGDLNTRIETRAAAYAAQRLALTGGTLTGTLNVNAQMQLNSGAGEQSFYFTRDNVSNTRQVLSGDGNFYIHTKIGAGDYYFGFKTDGGMTIPQFGDLNSRIEARGAAYRDAALATARSEDALRVAKAGDTMTGQLVIKYNYPGLELRANDPAGFPYIDFTNEAAQNVDFCWRFQTYGRSGDNIFLTGQDGGAKFTVAQSGAISTAQLGDLNTRIEARGLAYQQAAQGTSVQKAGDTMSGDLTISKAGSAGVRFIVPSQTDWFVRGIGGNRLQFCDGGATVEYLSFGAAGDISTRQFGDLNSRIESRGQAFAESAVNRSVTSIRWVYVGDLYNSYNLNNGMAEPYGGSAMTGRATNADGTANGAWIPGIFRWRQLQIYIPNQGWVATYYG